MILNASASAEFCRSFISSQSRTGDKPGTYVKPVVRRAVTISRQAGCGALVVAEKLAAYLKEHLPGEASWKVFDRNLMEKVMEDHNLPGRLARLIPEDRVSQIEDILADVFEVHPTAQTVIRQTTETMLKLAGLGNVILIGRGGNMITARLPHVIHVRLVAPLEKRIEHARQFYNMTETGAHKFCLSQDRARARYFKKYFNADIDDPLLYHAVINTGLVTYDYAAKMIGDAILNSKRG
jgi:cytidylate kinase